MPSIHFTRRDPLKAGSLIDTGNNMRGCYIPGFVLVTPTSQRSPEAPNGLVEVQCWWKNCVQCKGRRVGLSSEADKNMARMKYTTRKGSPIVDSHPESSRKKTRIENATRDASQMYQINVLQKGKEAIEKWEEEIKAERGGKGKNQVEQEVDWIIDTGETRTRETLYHKTLEIVWHTKMLIGKVKEDNDETRGMDQRELRTMVEDIQRRVSGLETIVKLLVDIEKIQQSKQDKMATQFNLYLKYVHHMDITPVDDHGTPTQI
jgi:hypothetical protein